MYELKVITYFSAAHQLREFKGPCEDLHGHNYKVEVCVITDTLDKAGIAIDFGKLKGHVAQITDRLDHAFLNDLEPFTQQNPSSENIARHVADGLTGLLQDPAIRVRSVTIWESEHSCATYYPS
ncbi:MAG: 6-carboxytetrahydropterin synthase QueD [Thermodesulfobacteriota bacterium]|nr:6-carboxytetrahydropterin synthase QueD [Thermodesulfobacteriota bacterium]